MPFGGAASGSGSGAGATVYNPPDQGAAAAAFGSLVSPWTNQALTGINQMGAYGSPYGTAFAAAQPYLGQASSLANQFLLPGDPNSFYTANAGTALDQAQNTFSQYASPTLFPQAQQGANALYQYGMNALPLGQDLWNTNIGLADNLYNQTIPYANQVAATAFDPQGALYNQQSGQALDSANVANAIAGLGGTPYGASNTANALNNFNIGWQNNLLNRQAEGGQAYSGLVNTGVGGYNTLTQSAMQDILSSLSGGAGALNASQQLGLQGAQGINQLALSPYQIGQMLAQGGMSSLSGLTGLAGGVANLGQSAYQLPQQVLNDLESYMQLGQSASQLSGQLGQMGFNQNAATIGGGLSGLNSLFGTNSLLGGSSGILGTGGLFGAGGLGGLFGGGSSAAASFAPDLLDSAALFAF